MPELYGSPTYREAAHEWGPPRPEDHIQEIIDIDTTAHERASTEKWWERLSKTEDGLVDRYFEEERSKLDENKQRIRVKEYRIEFDRDRQGYFEQLLAETSQEEWDTELQRAQELLTNLLTLLSQDEASLQQGLRGNLGIAALGQRGGIGEDASKALGKLLTTIAEGKADTQKAKAEANAMISGLIQTQIKVRTELLGATAKTIFEKLSEPTQAFIFRKFINFRYRFDEGTDRRTATLRVLMEMRENSPYRVFNGRDRFVWDALQKGWDIIDQLEVENDPIKRAKLQKSLERQKSIVRKWTSSIPGTWGDRDEFGPVGLLQVQNSAWAKVKGTINRFREPSDDENAPGKAQKTFVRQSASFRDESWEAQYLESDIYVQFGTCWNAYWRLDNFTDDERQLFIDNYFNAHYFRESKDIQKEISEKLDEEIAEHKEKIEAAQKDLEEARKLLPGEANQPSEIDEQINELEARQAELRDDIVELRTEYKERGQLQQPQQQQQPLVQGRRRGGGGQQQGYGLTYEKYKTLRDEQDRELEATMRQLRETREKRRQAEKHVAEAEQEIGRLRAEAKWASLFPDKENPTQINEAELERRKKMEAPIDNRLRSSNQAEDRYRAFHQKLHDFIYQDEYKDYHTIFTNSETSVICALTGMGIFDNIRSGRLTFQPGLTETGTAPLKVKVKEYQDDDPTKPLLVDEEGNNRYKEIVIDDDYRGDYNFLNPGAIPEWKGRISIDGTEQILRNPERYPKLANFINEIKDPEKNYITIEVAFPVRHDVEGGMQETPISHTGRVLDMQAATRLKELHGWQNIDLYKAWIDNPRIQEELGIRPDEVVARMISDRVRIHDWQRQLLEGFTVVNLSNLTAIPASDPDDAPMFFEYMALRQFDMYGRLSVEDVDSPVFYQYLPRTNEWSYTFNKADHTREVHFRNEIISSTEQAPQTEADLLFQSLMEQLRLYENRTRYFNNARRYTGDLSYDDTCRVGAYIKAHMDLIAQKLVRLRSIFDDPDPAKTPEDKIREMTNFRETEMIHLSYEILDARGRPKLRQRNKELWEHYNATAQWLAKLKRNQRDAEDRYVDTVTNPGAYSAVNGVTLAELAEADYLYNKNERLKWELEVYGLGLENTGQLNGLTNNDAATLLADRYADIDAEQFVRINKKHFEAVTERDRDIGPRDGGLDMLGRRIMGKFATSALTDVGRRLAVRLNEVGRHYGIELNLPGDRFMLNLSGAQLERILVKKQDHELFKRIAARMALGINTGYQDSWIGVFLPSESNDLWKNVGATDFELDRVGSRLMEIYKKRRSDDFVDATDRWLLMYGMDFLQDAKISGMRIGEVIDTVNNARMNDTSALEQDPTGRWQLNPHGKPGSKMNIVDELLLTLVRDRSRRPFTGAPAPLDNRFGPVNRNNPTAIEQYYNSLTP